LKILLGLLKKIKGANTNLVVAGCALFVSACALYISTQEVRIMRDQQKATMYPYLSISKTYNSNGFGIAVTNSGNGLAKVNSYQLFKEGIFFRDWFDVVMTSIPGSKIDYTMVKTSGNIKDEMITPNESVNLIFFQWSPETRAFQKHFEDLQVKICYSSLLDDSWIVTTMEASTTTEECVIQVEREFGL